MDYDGKPGRAAGVGCDYRVANLMVARSEPDPFGNRAAGKKLSRYSSEMGHGRAEEFKAAQGLPPETPGYESDWKRSP